MGKVNIRVCIHKYPRPRPVILLHKQCPLKPDAYHLSSRLGVIHFTLRHLTLLPPRYELYRRQCFIPAGNGLRRHTESSVHPLPTTTEVAVIQLSHADDEPRHDGA